MNSLVEGFSLVGKVEKLAEQKRMPELSKPLPIHDYPARRIELACQLEREGSKLDAARKKYHEARRRELAEQAERVKK